jgi:hypothetical protein
MEREVAKLLEGRVARLILLVVVSVCVVFDMVFCAASKTIECHILKNENYELCFLLGSYDQITTGKKVRYSRLAVGWNTLASRGLEEPAHASRGLEELFLQLCCSPPPKYVDSKILEYVVR